MGISLTFTLVLKQKAKVKFNHCFRLCFFRLVYDHGRLLISFPYFNGPELNGQIMRGFTGVITRL